MKDNAYQEVLKKARDLRLIGQSISVRLTHELNNPFDTKAIAFMCFIDDWQRIGYIVHEILDEVHAALQNNLIVRVEFSWIKFITDWMLSSPGFFAGVSVTKYGRWSQSLIRASTSR